MDLERAQTDTGPGKLRLSWSVPSLFGDVAAAHPEKTALLYQGGSLTYGELALAADRVAAHLTAMSIGPGAFVGIGAESSPAAIVAMLGVLKVGAAYIPFDPSYPEKLLDFIRQDSAPAAVLISRRQYERLPAATAGSAGLVIEDLIERPASVDFVADAATDAEDLTYVMYTSGSTGRPKGVMVPHRAIIRLVLDADYAGFAADEVFLQQAPLAFDASTFEIWGALLNGATLAIPPGGRASLDDIADAIQRFGVTTLWLTAGLFHLMAEHRLEALRPLRQLLAGGDVLSAAVAAKVRRALPHCRLINGYGPTENTTFTCCYSVPVDFDPAQGSIPIGTAINGTTIHVLDEQGRPVLDGESGELYAGGLGLALGYLNRPDLTAENFVSSPIDGARLYRTGDRVRRRTDGNLEFLGRVDRQVKINGKRIELDEIEATVRRSGLVRDAAAVVNEGAGSVRTIALFVTPPADFSAGVEPLRRFIAGELPDYMMPARIEFMPELPLSPTGKLDRTKLAASLARPVAVDAIGSTGETARVVIAAWRKALGSDAFGMEDNFFDVGGTSLQLVGMHADLQSAFGRSFPLIDLFSHSTVRALSHWLDRDSGVKPVSTIQQDKAAKRSASLARARLARGLTPS